MFSQGFIDDLIITTVVVAENTTDGVSNGDVIGLFIRSFDEKGGDKKWATRQFGLEKPLRLGVFIAKSGDKGGGTIEKIRKIGRDIERNVWHCRSFKIQVHK